MTFFAGARSRVAECPYEADVVEAVLAGQLDEGAGGEQSAVHGRELQMHVECCETCRDVVAVTSVLRTDRDLMRGDVPIPAAGQVWWRSAVRARLEATQAAARPLTWAQGVAGACAAGIAVTATTMAWPTIEAAFTWLGGQVWSVNPTTVEVADLVGAAVQRSLPLALALAAGVVLAPLALYLALSDD